ncbi:protein RNA-directed DNA methylation 3-like [Penaeus chinensis]|uniref:protein RNA-directed DNA methylation 3-like n=1 Tax=Penaeus chinensis TaxID=139456 RepID=UPI001FB7B2B7|nr:protein RNA-directed DNA methylation 3-like [Penaeus chinensis]
MCTTPMWLALLLLVGVNRAAVVGEDEGSWAACEEAVCHEVLRQTEGLHRLKLLRGYIIQTMRLMDKLVTSMDEELVQAGKGMADFIGPKCEGSHAFLRDIIATSTDADRRAVNENFSSTSQRENLIEDDSDDDRWTTQTSSATFRDEDDSREDDLEQSSSFISSTSTSTSTSSSSGRDFSSQSTTNKANAYGNGGKDLGGGPSHGSPRPPYVPPETPGATDWRGRGSTEGGRHTWSGGNRGHHGESGWREGHHRAETTTGRKYYTNAGGSTGSGWGGANDRNRGTGSGWGGASSGSTGSGWGGASSGGTGSGWGGANSGGTGSGWGGASGGNECKGIPPGSPNWVPGLDQWCAQNCRAGYCPEAQCVC